MAGFTKEEMDYILGSSSSTPQTATQSQQPQLGASLGTFVSQDEFDKLVDDRDKPATDTAVAPKPESLGWTAPLTESFKGLARGTLDVARNVTGAIPEMAGGYQAAQADVLRQSPAAMGPGAMPPANFDYKAAQTAVQQAPTPNPMAGQAAAAEQFFAPYANAPSIQANPTVANTEYLGNAPLWTKATKLASDVGQGAPSVAAAIGGAMVGGPAGAGVMGGALTASPWFEKARKEGLDEKNALAGAAVIGGGSAILNSIPFLEKLPDMVPAAVKGRIATFIAKGLAEAGTETAEGGLNPFAEVASGQRKLGTIKDFETLLLDAGKGIKAESGTIPASFLLGGMIPGGANREQGPTPNAPAKVELTAEASKIYEDLKKSTDPRGPQPIEPDSTDALYEEIAKSFETPEVDTSGLEGLPDAIRQQILDLTPQSSVTYRGKKYVGRNTQYANKTDAETEAEVRAKYQPKPQGDYFDTTATPVTPEQPATTPQEAPVVAPEPITQPEPIPVAPERGQGPVERPAEVGVPISPSRASVRAQDRPYPGERPTTTTEAPQFRGAIRRRGGEAVAAEAMPVQEPQSRAMALPSQEPVMEAQSAPFDLTTMPMEQIDAFMADEDARMDAKEQEVAKKYLTPEQQKIFNSIPNTEYGYRRKAKMFSNISDEAFDAFDNTAMADSPETASRYRQVETLREKLDKFTAGGTIEDETEANKDLELFLRDANFDDPVDVRVLQELTQRYDAAGLDVNKMLRTARAAYGTWFYAQTKDVNDALDMVALLDAKLGIPAQAEEPSSKPAAEFVGLQERPRGQEPIALYNIPTPDGGKTTVTAETAKSHGFSVPEPPAPVEAAAVKHDPIPAEVESAIASKNATDAENKLQSLRPWGKTDPKTSPSIALYEKAKALAEGKGWDWNAIEEEVRQKRQLDKDWLDSRHAQEYADLNRFRQQRESVQEKADAINAEVEATRKAEAAATQAKEDAARREKQAERNRQAEQEMNARREETEKLAENLSQQAVDAYGKATSKKAKAHVVRMILTAMPEKARVPDEWVTDAIHSRLIGIVRPKLPATQPVQAQGFDVPEPTQLPAPAETEPAKQPWEMTREEYDSEKPPLKPRQSIVLDNYGKKTEVVQNPTNEDIARLSDAVRKKFPDMPKGEVKLRQTRDEDGNEYVWQAHEGMHGTIEPMLQDIVDSALNQNAQKKPHRNTVYDALLNGKEIPPEVLAQYPEVVDAYNSTKGKQKRPVYVAKPDFMGRQGDTEQYSVSLYRDGKLVGDGTYTVSADGTARIGKIHSFKGANSIGADGILSMRKDLMRQNPKIKKFVGDRVTGATAKTEQPAPEAKPESQKAVLQQKLAERKAELDTRNAVTYSPETQAVVAPKPTAPPKSLLELKKAKDRVDKHGLTKDQMAFLTDEIQARWSELPNKNSEYEGVPNVATIKVPGDGTFIIGTQEAANAIHKRLTGKWIDESMAYDSKKSGASSPVDPRDTPDYMKGSAGGYNLSAKAMKERQQAEDEALRLLNEAKTPNDVAYARIQYDRAMGVKEATPKAIEKPVEEAPKANTRNAAQEIIKKYDRFYPNGSSMDLDALEAATRKVLDSQIEKGPAQYVGEEQHKRQIETSRAILADIEAAKTPTGRPTPQVPAEEKSAPKTTASEKQPYEMTSEEYFQSELEKNRYKSKYEQDPKAMANLRNIKEQEWLDMLYAQAEVDTLPLNVIDDYVSKFGEGELKRRFRGRLEKGIAGWMPTDVRREGTNRETFYGFTDGEKPLKAGMIAKALNREQQFAEGKMTIRQWIDKKYTAGELYAASEVKNKMTDTEREWLAKHRETFKNSPNKELEAKAKKEKTVYTINGIDLGKVAYDYAKYRLDTEASMLESRTTEQQFNPEQAKAPEIVVNTESDRFRQEELGKVLPNFERMVKREASPQNMLIVAEQFMDGEAPYIKEAIASRLWEISPEAAALGSELKYGKGDVFKSTQPESSMQDVTSQPSTTTASVPKKTTVKRILESVPSNIVSYDPSTNTISFDPSDEGITKVRDAVDKALDSLDVKPALQAKYEEAHGDIMDAVFSKQEDAPKPTKGKKRSDETGAVNIGLAKDAAKKVLEIVKKAASAKSIEFSHGLGKDTKNANVVRVGTIARLVSEGEQAVIDFNEGYRTFINEGKGRVKSAANRFKEAPEDMREMLNKFLIEQDPEVKQARLETIPEPMRESAERMRTTVDALSRQLRNEGVASKATAEKIENQEGYYLRRTFKIFKDPDWKNQISEKMKDAVRKHIAKEEELDPSSTEVTRILNGYMNIADNTEPSIVRRGKKLGTKDLSTLQKRGEFDQSILDLWGVEQDGIVNFLETLTAQANLIANHRFLRAVARIGEGKTVFSADLIKAHTAVDTDPSHPDFNDEYDRLIRENRLVPFEEGAAKKERFNPSEIGRYGAMAGSMVERDFKEAMQEAVAHHEITGMLGELAFLNSVTKAGMTALSPKTASLNFWSNSFIAAQAHHLFYGSPKAIANRMNLAMKVAKIETSTRHDKGIRALGNKLIGLGVLKDTIGTTELQKQRAETKKTRLASLMKKAPEMADSAIEKVYGADPHIFKYISNALGMGVEQAFALYQAGDDVWKTFGWLAERDMLKEAYPNWSERQIDVESALRVRRFYTTYSELPNAVKTLRHNPLIAPFVAFYAEVPRGMANTMLQAKQDIVEGQRTGNAVLRNQGLKRAGSMMVAAATLEGISQYYKMKNDVDDDDEETLRMAQPSWDKAGAFGWYDIDRVTGKAKAYNLSAMVPQAIAFDPLTAFFRAETIGQGVHDFAKELASPLYQPEIGFMALRNQWYGIDSDNKPIFTESDPMGEQWYKRGAQFWKDMSPGAYKSVVNVSKAEDKVGKAFDELSGQRTVDVDLPKSLFYKAIALQKAGQEQNRDIGKAVKAEDREAIMEQYKQRVEAHKLAWREASDMIKGMKRFGVDDMLIVKSLKEAGLDTPRDRNRLINGNYVEPKMPDWVKKALAD